MATTWVLQEVERHGYLVVGATVAAESAGVPIPGESALLVAAFLARQGHLDIFTVIGVAAVAAIVGDNLGYVIGRRLGRRFLDRYGRWMRLTPARIASGERFFERHGGKAVFLARWFAGLRVAGAWLAGATRMSWPRFATWNAIGGVFWAIAIGTAGYLLGASYQVAEHYLGAFGLVMAAVAVAVFAWHSVRRGDRYRRWRDRHRGSPDRGEPAG